MAISAPSNGAAYRGSSMNPCQVRKSGKALLCLCHGHKAKWKDDYFCIAQAEKVDWPLFQAEQVKQLDSEDAGNG